MTPGYKILRIFNGDYEWLEQYFSTKAEAQKAVDLFAVMDKKTHGNRMYEFHVFEVWPPQLQQVRP